MQKLSVIVPVYNKKEYLNQCLDSIINQSYKEIEIILVDDGSTDGSGDICDSYAKKDNRIQVIHQVNKGMSHARYSGLQVATSEYVTFVDADDWLMKDGYCELLQYMEQKIDVIIFQMNRYFHEDYQFIDADIVKEGIYGKDALERDVYPYMLWHNNRYGINASLCNKIIKKNLLVKYLEQILDFNISYGEDIAVTYPLLYNIETMCIVKKPIYNYRQRVQNDVAEYILDDLFIQKTYRLYKYLMNALGRDKKIFKQINQFYHHSIALYMEKSNQISQNDEILFPFQFVQSGKRIILYGAGKIGKIYKRQIEQLNYCKNVIWIDSKANIDHEKIYPVEYIKEVQEYDYVVIAIKNQKTVERIVEELVEKYNIPRNKIVWNHTSQNNMGGGRNTLPN